MAESAFRAKSKKKSGPASGAASLFAIAGAFTNERIKCWMADVRFVPKADITALSELAVLASPSVRSAVI